MSEDSLEERKLKALAALHQLRAELGAWHDGEARRPGHDRLTGLPGCEPFDERAGQAILRAKRIGRPAAFAYVSVDGLAAVRAQYGAGAADAFVVESARRLGCCVRGTDFVACLGPGEYGLVLEHLGMAESATLIAGKVQHAVTAPMELIAADGTAVRASASASIGIAVYPDHATTQVELLGRADLALDAARRAGGGVRVFHESLQSAARRAPELRVVGGPEHQRS